MKTYLHAALTLGVILSFTAASHARTISWGTDLDSVLLDSNGSQLGNGYIFELGTFGTFVPTDSNRSQWLINWKVFDRATAPDTSGYNQADGLVGHSAVLEADYTTSNEALPQVTFAVGEKAYIMAYNALTFTTAGTELALITNPTWTIPTSDTHSPDTRDWRINNAGTVPYGGLKNVQGPGGHLASPSVFTLQTHTDVIPGKPTTWAAWLTANPLGGQNAPTQNPDGDIYDNLQEFAFCTNASSGLTVHCPLQVVITSGGKMNAVYTKVKNITGMTYTLEYISDLSLSGANGAGWTPITTITPSIVDNADGTETCTVADLESVPALNNGKGFVRLKLDLASPATTSRTYAAGWMDRTITQACETYSNPFIDCEIFSGTVDSNTTGALNITTAVGTGSFASAMVAGKTYYVEVINGPSAGHRWNVIAGSTATSIALGTGTKALSANALAGSNVIVREAKTLAGLFSPAIYVAGSNANNSDKILTYDPNTVAKWNVYFLNDQTAGGKGIHWVKQGDNTAASQDELALDACQGIFMHHRAAAITTTQVGHVRQNAMACPLIAGQNLVGTGYPVDQHPAARAMTWNGTSFQGFTGSVDPVRSDNVLFWKGDTTLNAENYSTYWLVDAGFNPYRRWSMQGDNALNSQDASNVFKATRASFYKSTTGNPNYVLPLGWTP